MPYSRPTLSTLRSQVASDITSGLNTTDGLLRWSNLGILGTAVAGLAHLHYGYLDWIAKQATPYTATGEVLQAWAALKKVYPEAATYANLTVTFMGTAGTDLPAATAVSRADGVTYTTAADATVGSAGTVAVTVVADTAGTDGNAAVGTAMYLTSSVSGVQSTGAVTAIVSKGTATESDDSLRTRMLAKYQAAARGGAQSDYEVWALDATGVTRAWVNPRGAGPGTVVVYFMMDTVNSDENGFPQGTDGISSSDDRATAGNSATGDQLSVANAMYSSQPVTAMTWLCAPTASPVDFTISGISSVTSTIKTAITQAIEQVMLDAGAPLADGSYTDLSDIESAIAAISGTSGFVIEAPTANIANALGYLPTLGTITYE